MRAIGSEPLSLGTSDGFVSVLTRAFYPGLPLDSSHNFISESTRPTGLLSIITLSVPEWMVSLIFRFFHYEFAPLVPLFTVADEDLGGTQVMVFIMSFAFFGASGKAVPFPDYWGNNFQSSGESNYDYCMRNLAN